MSCMAENSNLPIPQSSTHWPARLARPPRPSASAEASQCRAGVRPPEADDGGQAHSSSWSRDSNS